MSYIFEALQRAEAERSGGSLPKNADSVADLLQGVEQEIERKQSLSELPPAAKPESPEAETFASAKVLLPALAADARLVCLTDQGGLAAEKFRVLGLKLRHLRERRKLKRIVVTSTRSGRRKKSGRGQSGAQSVAQQGFEDAADGRRSAAASLGQPIRVRPFLAGTERVFARRAAAF